MVTIVDPGIKYQPPAPGAHDAASHPELAPQDQSYYVYNQGQAQDYFLKRKDGRPYIARVWPGDRFSWTTHWSRPRAGGETCIAPIRTTEWRASGTT